MEVTAAVRRWRRWWLPPLVLAVLVGLYALGGFFGVPWLVRSVATKQVAQIGRQLAIGEIRFNPFTFEAQVTGLRLGEADGAPLLAFDALYVDAMAWQSIVQRGAVLAAIRLTTPDVAVVVLADGTLNFAHLAPPSSEPPSEPGPPPKIVIGDLAIERGRVTLEDRSRPTPFATTLTPVELHLHDFRTDPEHASGLQFRAVATTGEQLDWNGNLSVQPFASSGHIDLRGLKTSTVTAYLQDQLPVRLASGVADVAADYRLVLQPTLGLDLTVPEATMKDLALAEPRSDRPPIAIGEIAIRETTVSLAQREVKVGRVAIEKPSVVVTREEDGALNLARLVVAREAAPATAPSPSPSPSPSPPTTTPSTSEPAWRVTVGRVDIAGGVIDVSDHSVKPAVNTKIAALTAGAKDLSLDPSAPVAIEVSLNVGATGHVATQGTIRQAPLSGELKLELQDLDLSIVQPYLQPHTGVVVRSARLGVAGTLAFAVPAEASPTIDFDGDASLRDLDVEERAGKRDLLTWSSLEVKGIAYRHAQKSLAIERADLSRPKARVEISEDRHINVADALKAPGAPPPVAADPPEKASAKKEEPAKPMTVQLKTFHVERGELAFSDRSIQPSFSAAIHDLAGDVLGISTAASARTKIQLAGKVDAFSPVLISGEIAPVAYDRHTDITMSFRNMDLVRFNPYSGKFAGYNIVKGKLTTDLHYTIHDRALTAEHHVVLDQLEFGDATGSKEAVPLPVKLAVALLKDRNGLIDLQLPISGSLDDPSFKVAPVIGKVLVSMITKAVTAPFSLLAGLFGGSEEIAWVDFAPGRAELRESESAKMTKLSQALVERPQLKLDIPLTLAAQPDGEVLARDELAKRVPPAADKERLKVLRRTYEELLGSEPDFPKEIDEPAARIAWLESSLLPKLTPDEAALRQLSDDRARAVQAALLANPGIAPERVFLTGETSSETSDDGDVRMRLAIKP